MMDRLLTGLTKTQAERCLDWLQNHGYPGCQAQLHGDLWSIVVGAQSPTSGGTGARGAKHGRLGPQPLLNRLSASGS